jgi:starch phosphorylase
MTTDEGGIAYFSMEVGLESAMPTYSGGLGILAGDTLRAAADLKFPLVAMTLLHRHGYFYQHLDDRGQQIEQPVQWPIHDFLQPLPSRVSVSIEGRTVVIAAWKHEVIGCSGHYIPVYLLDTDLPENAPWDRELTHYLYGGDAHYRLCQEVVLGIGGLRMLRELGHAGLNRFHMNEGHASFLSFELLRERARAAGREVADASDVEAVRQLCVFTTHTPVAAGHDRFPWEMIESVLGHSPEFALKNVFCCDGAVNMTYLALNLSHYVNGVAKRHGETTQRLFAKYQIDSITNGVHAATWTGPAFQRLFDKYIPGWREDNLSLRYAISIPPNEVWAAHEEQKDELLRVVNHTTNAGFDCNVLTLGFARRFAAYKRPDLLLQDLDRLSRMTAELGPLQVLFAGKAHPQDQAGKELIRQVWEARQRVGSNIRIAFLENYDMDLARRITSGVDAWLNTPQPPLEASGTSGMKAALNGIPSLSVLDGWWIEGCIEGVTGWAIGNDHAPSNDDSQFLLDKLEQAVLPVFYHDRPKYVDIMRHAIALNGAFFNTHRMMQQYATKAYLFGGHSGGVDHA